MMRSKKSLYLCTPVYGKYSSFIQKDTV